MCWGTGEKLPLTEERGRILDFNSLFQALTQREVGRCLETTLNTTQRQQSFLYTGTKSTQAISEVDSQSCWVKTNTKSGRMEAEMSSPSTVRVSEENQGRVVQPQLHCSLGDLLPPLNGNADGSCHRFQPHTKQGLIRLQQVPAELPSMEAVGDNSSRKADVWFSSCQSRAKVRTSATPLLKQATHVKSCV